MLKTLKWIGITFLAFVTLILLVYFWYFIEVKIKLKNYPEFLNYKFYLVKEESGLKDIDIDDLLIINEKDNITNGKIVLYLDNNSTYDIARVINISSVSVSLKKDLSDVETTLSSSVIVGSINKKLTGAGLIIEILSNKALLIILGVLGFILVVFAQEKLNKPKQIF